MSERRFADTNLFIRLFTRDDPVQTPLVVALFRRAAAGEFTLVTTRSVIEEIVWTLEKRLNVTSTIIHTHIWSILNTPGIEVEDADLIGQAADIYANKNIDFVDAFNICWMKANDIKIAHTFDRRQFSRVEGIEVQVPQ